MIIQHSTVSAACASLTTSNTSQQDPRKQKAPRRIGSEDRELSLVSSQQILGQSGSSGGPCVRDNPHSIYTVSRAVHPIQNGISRRDIFKYKHKYKICSCSAHLIALRISSSRVPSRSKIYILSNFIRAQNLARKRRLSFFLNVYLSCIQFEIKHFNQCSRAVLFVARQLL